MPARSWSPPVRRWPGASRPEIDRHGRRRNLAALGADPGVSTVDVINGGLMRAATILQARTGVMVTFEGVPRDIEGLHYRVEPTLRSPGHEKLLTDKELRFDYPAGATALDALAASRRIVVTRTINNQVKQMDVAEDTLLQPGDVVDIKKVRTRERAKGASIEAPKERAQANAASQVRAPTCTWANGRRSGAACV